MMKRGKNILSSGFTAAVDSVLKKREATRTINQPRRKPPETERKKHMKEAKTHHTRPGVPHERRQSIFPAHASVNANENRRLVIFGEREEKPFLRPKKTQTNPGARRLKDQKKGQNMNSSKVTHIKSFLPRGLKPALLATAILLLAAALPALAGKGNAGNPGILPPQSFVYGKTYADWSVKWWQWVFSLPASNSPILDTGDCSAGQSGPVWFLAGAFGVGTTHTRSCTIPAGVALFFPIANGWADDTDCPSYDTFSVEQLVGFATGFVDSASGMSCTIDGVPVKGLDDPITSPYRVGPQVFSYTLASTDNLIANFFGLACIADGITVAPAAEDGVYLLLAPLSAGQHTIHFTVESYHLDITYHLTVN